MKLKTVSLSVLSIIFFSAALVRAASIRGKVFDASDLQPLPGSVALIAGTNLGASANEKGEYEINGLSAGAYTMLVTLVGYNGVSIRRVNVPEFGSVTINAYLAVYNSTEDKTIYYEEGKSDYNPLTDKGFRVATVRDPPTITVIEPLLTGRTTIKQDKELVVRGTAADDRGVTAVWVNNTPATVGRDAVFTARLDLVVGENRILVKAIDEDGITVQESFTIVRQGREAVEPFDPLVGGNYYALIIAVADYGDPSLILEHPKTDASLLRNTLLQDYAFSAQNMIFLKDPDRAEMLMAFEKLSRKTTPQDNVLIFFAGHGYWDKQSEQGYWLPRNASPDSKIEWVSNSTIRDQIKGIKSRHTLLITDACFGGAIFKMRSVSIRAPSSIAQLYRLPSRKAMTSGAMSEVPDKSTFIEYLMKRLIENTEHYLPAEQLFSSFRLAVMNNSPANQVPQFGEIREAGDEGGDFIFVKRTK